MRCSTMVIREKQGRKKEAVEADAPLQARFRFMYSTVHQRTHLLINIDNKQMNK